MIALVIDRVQAHVALHERPPPRHRVASPQAGPGHAEGNERDECRTVVLIRSDSRWHEGRDIGWIDRPMQEEHRLPPLVEHDRPPDGGRHG